MHVTLCASVYSSAKWDNISSYLRELLQGLNELKSAKPLPQFPARNKCYVFIFVIWILRERSVHLRKQSSPGLGRGLREERRPYLEQQSCPSSLPGSLPSVWHTAGSPKMTVGCRISARGFLPLVHSFTYGKWVLRRTNRPQNIRWQEFSPSHPLFSLPCPFGWHKDHPLQSLLGLPFPLPAPPPRPPPRPCRGVSRGIGSKLQLMNRPQAPAQR